MRARRFLPWLVCSMLVVTGCTVGNNEGPDEPESPPSATTSPSGSPGEDRTPTAEPSTPPTPAADTSGELDGDVFPTQVADFAVTPAESGEGEFHPNETPYYALDPGQSSTEAVRACSARPAAGFTAPEDALGAYYVNGAGAPGRALVFRFASDADAEAYFTLLGTEATACAEAEDPGLGVDDLTVDDATISSRVTFAGPEKWSEVIVRDGDRVGLLILNDGHATAFTDMLVLADTIRN